MPNDVLGFVWEFLGSLLFYIPYLIAYSIGMLLAVVNWHRWPRACQFTLFAFLIKLAAVMGISLALTFAMRGELPFPLYERIVFFLGLVDASAYALLLLAIFKARGEPTRRRPSWYDEPHDEEPPRPPQPVDPGAIKH